ncbi:MAG: anti-sigma factor antagonist, partial [Solirubrobacteraceae bacterium]|nr:anti-sigma factor antagonist [Solirubrobacteraceae bacterium]
TMSQFSVSTERSDGAVRVRLTGELDIGTAGQAEEQIREVEGDEGAAELILDLEALTFMDSTGLRMLVAADARARETGRTLTIVRGPDAVQRVIELTGLESKLNLVDEI